MKSGNRGGSRERGIGEQQNSDGLTVRWNSDGSARR